MRDFNRTRDNRGRGEREMFDAVCDECGNNCKVPFKPTGNKPIFCSHCFENQGASDLKYNRSRDRGRDRGRDRSFSRPASHSQEREMFDAVCDECGEKCEIPFKPSNDKPIFCSTCFSKKNEGNSRVSRGANKNNSFEDQFQAINKKLDEILQTLSSTKTKKVVKKELPKEKTVKKKVSPKKSKKEVLKKITKKKTIKKKK